MDSKRSPQPPVLDLPAAAPLQVERTSPHTAEAQQLIDALSEQLGARFGSDGRASFTDWQENDSRYIFLLARRQEEAVGCGAVRYLAPGIGEVKRMYARYARQGIGEAVLQQLEQAARQAGYAELWLETRVANTEACRFYAKHGYQRRANYGQYIGRDNSACFARQLLPGGEQEIQARQLVQEYLAAYNRIDVEGMLRPLHDDVVFTNSANGEVNLATYGKEAFRQQAAQATRYFAERAQLPTRWLQSADRVEVQLDYRAIAAIDLPNGLQRGDTLQLQGRSVFRVAAGKIISIEDIS